MYQAASWAGIKEVNTSPQHSSKQLAIGSSTAKAPMSFTKNHVILPVEIRHPKRAGKDIFEWRVFGR
jgi:hypothetical protein